MANTEARSTIKLFRRSLRRVLAGAVLLLGSFAANAQAVDCSSFPNATLDGFVNPNPPSNINIDTNCTIRNFPASNPLDTNFAFFTQPGQTDERWLIIFDNVVHTGQMACNAVLEHKIWFVNGSSSSIQEGCQNLLIPVEKIDKQNPPGNNTAAIGVPFTWTLTSPVLFDPATNTWTALATMPYPVSNISLIYHPAQHKIYIVGGYTGSGQGGLFQGQGICDGSASGAQDGE